MGKSGIIVTGLVAIALVIGIIVVAKNDNNQSANQSNSGNTTSTEAQTPATEDGTQVPESANMITYSNNGFSPSTLTVKSGDSVIIKNNSNTAIDIESAPHPVHSDNSELNVGTVGAGKSTTFKLTKPGTWGYHNHPNPSETGTIVVQ